MGIEWQDKIKNNEVLQRAKMDGMEAMLIRAQLRCCHSCHVQRMSAESHAETNFLFGAVLRRQK